jgi:hypothetical protein
MQSAVAESNTEAPKPVVAAAATTPLAGWTERDAFELALRKAKVYAASTLVPKEYRDDVANCLIALNMARRINADELMVMQNLYMVNGKPGWSAQFLIATFNQCGRFSAMRFQEVGDITDRANWGYRAYAVERATGEKITGPWVTWKMVEAEGWNKRGGSKWQTIPDLMFHYRAGAFLVRTHAPEIAMGLPTVEELRDVIDVTPEADNGGGSKAEALARTLRAARDLEATPREEPTMTYAQVADAIAKAESIDLLEVAEQLAQTLSDPRHVEELMNIAAERRKQLS